jgi:hypothetical protein
VNYSVPWFFRIRSRRLHPPRPRSGKAGNPGQNSTAQIFALWVRVELLSVLLLAIWSGRIHLCTERDCKIRSWENVKHLAGPLICSPIVFPIPSPLPQLSARHPKVPRDSIARISYCCHPLSRNDLVKKMPHRSIRPDVLCIYSSYIPTVSHWLKFDINVSPQSQLVGLILTVHT